jgi:hypothetical protein
VHETVVEREREDARHERMNTVRKRRRAGRNEFLDQFDDVAPGNLFVVPGAPLREDVQLEPTIVLIS